MPLPRRSFYSFGYCRRKKAALTGCFFSIGYICLLYTSKYVTAYRDRIFYSADRIEKIPYLSLVRPKGTFYLFPGVEKTGLDDKPVSYTHLPAAGGTPDTGVASDRAHPSSHLASTKAL